MRMRHFAAAAAVILTLTGTAQAALFDRGGGMIYDDELNITWLQNWNQVVGTSNDTYQHSSGLMNWSTANTWADNLVWGGFSDWRLPTIVDTGAPGCDLSWAGGTDCGANVQTKSGTTVYSEMAHMYFVTLGNKSSCPSGEAICVFPQAGWGLVNTGPFKNVQSDFYWSATEYAPNLGYAWTFWTLEGSQVEVEKRYGGYAVAVRPGDVVAVVPEPQTNALLMLGLGAVMLAARRRPR